MNEFCRIANEKEWVHQIHVGTHNLKHSSPLPLEDLGNRYPKMKIVMLHCWPFTEEAAFLAKEKPNFYIDNCWIPILSPAFCSQAMDTYLNFVPYNKIMLSNDATSIEMAVGSSLFTREILEKKLLEQKSMLNLTDEQLRIAALDMLHNNAVRVYGIGAEVK
jgi:predicted TIM-barrel fold metal-dependent hydrolase